MIIEFIERLMELRFDYLERKSNIKEREEELLTRCDSCETLKMELARAHDENMKLLTIITAKPEPEKAIDTSELKPIKMNKHIPFNVRRQMLEQEDRAAARVKAEVERNAAPELTKELEAEMNIVSTEREAQSGVRVVNGEKNED